MKTIKTYIAITLTLLTTIPCHAMEPEDRIDPAKMALVKRYGLTGYIIKQLGITYNDNGSVRSFPLPGQITDQIIENIKRAEAQGLQSFILNIPNPSDYFTKNKTSTSVEKLRASGYSWLMQNIGQYMPQSWQSDYSQKQDHFNANRHYTGAIINPCRPEIAAATITDIVLWDLINPYRPVPTILPFDMANINSFAYNPTGSQIAISRHGSIKICDLETKKVVSTEVPVQHAIGFTYSLLFSHDGNKLIAYRNDGETGRVNIYDVTKKTWSFKTIDRIMLNKLARYDDDFYVGHSSGGGIRVWNSNFEQCNNVRVGEGLFDRQYTGDTDVHHADEDFYIPFDRINRVGEHFLENGKLRIPFVSADRTKFARVHNVPSHIVYRDTNPDVKNYTIDQLRMLKQSQPSNRS